MGYQPGPGRTHDSTPPLDTETDLSHEKLTLYTIVVNGLRALHKDYNPVGSTLLLILFSVALGLGMGVGFIALVHWIGDWFGGCPNWVLYAVGLLPLSLVVLFCKMVQFGFGDSVRVDTRAGVQQLVFDQFDIALGATLLGLAFFLGVGLGVQTSLLHYTSDHCTVPGFQGRLWDSMALTLDNLFHGVFIYICELYRWHLAHRVDHSNWSATVFLAFRISFDVIIIIMVVALFQRRRVAHLMSKAADLIIAPTPRKLVDYLRASCYGGLGWSKTYHDEFIFFCLVEKYLSGKYEECRVLAELFPDVGIPQNVRALFVDPDGRPLL